MHLGATFAGETAEYVKSRMANGGAKATELFPDETLEAVHIYGQGIPRVVNLLCEHALLEAFAEKSSFITPEVISRVASTFDLTPGGPGPPRASEGARLRTTYPEGRADEKTTEVAAGIAAFAEKRERTKGRVSLGLVRSRGEEGRGATELSPDFDEERIDFSSRQREAHPRAGHGRIAAPFPLKRRSPTPTER